MLDKNFVNYHRLTLPEISKVTGLSTSCINNFVNGKSCDTVKESTKKAFDVFRYVYYRSFYESEKIEIDKDYEIIYELYSILDKYSLDEIIERLKKINERKKKEQNNV